MAANNCKYCKERFVGCHSTCQSYKEFKAAHEERREMIKRKKKDNALFLEYKANKIKKEMAGKW